MIPYSSRSAAELTAELAAVRAEYETYKQKGLALDMSRGKPSSAQLDLYDTFLTVLKTKEDCYAADGTDCRNYGILDGIPEVKQLFADLLGISPKEVFVGGNSSLNLMHDAIARAMMFGVCEGCEPWSKQEKIKFLCPVPGYDRHFGLCEMFGIEMVSVPMLADGPDMDLVERLVSEDAAVKGIWCVPQYSNPEGKTYSDDVVRRFANLCPAAADFRIFWDNAYVVHHLQDDHPTLLNLMAELKKTGKEDMLYMFFSTSKITYPGAGVSVICMSEKNLAYQKKYIFYQTIGHDKLNQLRHVKFFGNAEGVHKHMKRHAAVLKPHFDVALQIMEEDMAGLGVAEWFSPEGGYFISMDVPDGCAKRVVALMQEAGVKMTGAGATHPYGKDPRDRNIRIAPTYPPLDELEISIRLMCVCVKLAALEQLTK